MTAATSSFDLSVLLVPFVIPPLSGAVDSYLPPYKQDVSLLYCECDSISYRYASIQTNRRSDRLTVWLARWHPVFIWGVQDARVARSIRKSLPMDVYSPRRLLRAGLMIIWLVRRLVKWIARCDNVYLML